MVTDNLGLNKPTRGTNDWDVPLNENFEILEKHALIQVPSVSTLKSDYTPHDQTIAFIENSREFYAGTGSGWVLVGHLKQTPHDVYVQSEEPADAKEGDVWIVP